MLKISQKIFIIFTVQLAVFFGMLVFKSAMIVKLDKNAQEVTKINLKDEAFVRNLDDAFNMYFLTVESSMSSLDLEQIKGNRERLKVLSSQIKEISKTPTTYNTKIFASPENELWSNLELLNNSVSDVFDNLEVFSQLQAQEIYTTQALPVREKIVENIAAKKQKINESLKERQALMRETLKTVIDGVYLAMALMFMITVLLGAFLWRSTITPIKALREFVGNKFKDIKSTEMPFTERKDEIGDFARSFKNLFEQKEAYEIEVQAQSVQLVDAKEEAERASQAKTDFLANMSHELRTPLNSIIGLLQLCDKDDMGPQSWEMVEIIKKSSSSLISTVNDILDLSKIEAGEVRLEYMAFDVNDKISTLVKSMAPMASKRGLSVKYEGVEGNLYVLGDPIRFLRIFTNIIGNAMRYTEEGGVTVRVSYEAIFDDQIMLHCEVEDTGIGISEERVDSIFEKFTQADSSTTRKYGGTGLGLTITRELVELMDGVIGVDSQIGKGSVFWFQIPFETVAELPESADSDFDIDGEVVSALPPMAVNVLIAEDHDMNQAFMKRLLKNLGFVNYKMVENGALAVKEVNDNFYDMVLMDVHMPEMNGYQATQAIRMLDDLSKQNIPIIAMTANAMPEDEEKCLDIGMDAYISKPVDVPTFKHVLSRWIDFDAEGVDAFDIDNSVVDFDVPTSKNLEEAAQKDKASKPENDTEELVDLSVLIDSAMGNEAFVKEMIQMFADQSAKQLEDLSKLVDTLNDEKEWVEASHSLKGSAAGVGANEMRELCATSQNMDASEKGERKEMYEKIAKARDAAKEALIEKGYLAP